MNKTRTYYILFLTLLFSVNILFAQKQQKTRGSYSKISAKSFSDLDRVQGNLIQAKSLFNIDAERALDLVHDALLIAIKENFLSQEAEAYQILGEFNFELNEYNLSYKNYKKSIAIYEKLSAVSTKGGGDSPQLNSLFYPTGKAAELTRKYKNSIVYYNKFLQNASALDDKIKAYIGLGDVYLKKNELQQAQINYEKALKLEKKQNNKKGIALLNLKLGKLENSKNNDLKAIEYFRNSQNTANQINDDKLVNQAYTNISNIYESNNNIEQGVQINEEALNFNQQRNNTFEESKNNIDLANFLIKQNKDEEAIQYLENTVQIADASGDIENKSKAFKALSEAYNKTGQESEAMKKYKEYLVLEDSLYQLRKRQLTQQNKKGAMLENAQNKLSLLEKDKQLSENTIELLKQERIIQEENMARQRIISYALIFGILILIVTAFLVYRSNKAKNKANQLLVLKSLRAQMNPHFIFNALNSVNSFISNSDERAANRYLSDFSRLMRDVMENSQEDFITLSKEVDILSMYLKLENHRFKDKFDYSFDVDENINTEDVLIPPMLIQPYIENAVWHGLRYKKEKGFLKVNIKNVENGIVVIIEDDGIGRKKSQEIKTENQKILKSTGIKNIDSRLKIISEVYKTKLDVIIEDIEPSGTKVTVKINS